MYSLAFYFIKNYNFTKDFFYFRLYNVDDNLYEKLSLYHNSMHDIYLFFYENIQLNNYQLNLDKDMISNLKLYNNKLKFLNDNYSNFISKFDENCFNIMFSESYLNFLRKHISEEFIYISSYIMKYSKHVRFSMLEQIKKINSYSCSLQLDDFENQIQIENENENENKNENENENKNENENENENKNENKNENENENKNSQKSDNNSTKVKQEN